MTMVIKVAYFCLLHERWWIMCSKQHTTVPVAEKSVSQKKKRQRTAQKMNALSVKVPGLSSVFWDQIKHAQCVKVQEELDRRLINLLKAES